MTDPAFACGTVSPGLEEVAEVFRRQLAASDDDHAEIGAAISIMIDGEPALDLWGGFADPARTRPWERDTLVHVYSTTKGMTALCALMLADRGKLDLDAPVAELWPEFAAAGKGAIPVRWLLSHRAGLPALREMLPGEALYSFETVASALAAEAPWFPPGELAYHAVTFGWLVGEVVRRASGRSPGRFLRDEIAEPLGADVHVGLGDAEIARCADITMIPVPDGLDMAPSPEADPGQNLAFLAFANPMGTGDHNCEAHRRAEIPAINGHATARGLARVYGALARGGELDGVRLLSPDLVAACSHQEIRGADHVTGLDEAFGPGFMLNAGAIDLGRGARSFGHAGAGGSVAFADPDARIGFAYVCNRLGGYLDIDPRPRALIDALYRVV
jgi:CubicO group peptidase (beta-lactamase class C family)